MKKKGLFWLIMLVGLMGCGGCFEYYIAKRIMDPDYETRPREYVRVDVVYSISILSDEASDITVYLPFPHYKGKLDKRILQWLGENLKYKLDGAKEWKERAIMERLKWVREKKEWIEKNPEKGGNWYIEGIDPEDEKTWYIQKVRPYDERVKFYSKTKIDLIDTEYGKMLSIYIPEVSKGSIGFTTDEGVGSREIKIKENTVVEDYKLTYEDKIKIEDIERFPPSKERSDFYLKSILNLPIYAEFKGEGLIVSVGYSISTSYHAIPTTYFSYSFVNPQESPDTEKYYYSPINNSGWHWIPVLKTILDEEKIRKEAEILGKRLKEMKKR